VPIFALELNVPRNFSLATTTPGCPKIEQNYLSPVRRQPDGGTVSVRKREIGSRFAYGSRRGFVSACSRQQTQCCCHQRGKCAVWHLWTPRRPFATVVESKGSLQVSLLGLFRARKDSRKIASVTGSTEAGYACLTTFRPVRSDWVERLREQHPSCPEQRLLLVGKLTAVLQEKLQLFVLDGSAVHGRRNAVRRPTDPGARAAGLRP